MLNSFSFLSSLFFFKYIRYSSGLVLVISRAKVEQRLFTLLRHIPIAAMHVNVKSYKVKDDTVITTYFSHSAIVYS